MDNACSKKIKASSLILLIAFLFMARIILFAGMYGGVEHDSGWYLGVAKNLAHRGIYASYTNTIKQASPGPNPSIHGRFSVQDSNGFSYFPAGVTAGPGYIIPQAIFLKVFGDGWWQYRLWPLISFAVLLLLLLFIAWYLGGWISFLILTVWLWAVPQLYTTMAYEAFSESIALLYLLISILLYCKSFNNKNSYLFMFVAGVTLALSVLTKTLFVLTSIGFGLMFVLEIKNNFKKFRQVVIKWLLFSVAVITILGAFELYRFIVLSSNFGKAGWEAINADMRLHFQSNGSGISSLDFKNFNWPFFVKKLTLWLDVGIGHAFIGWIFFILSPLSLKKVSDQNKKLLFILCYLAALITFIWFVIFSPTGWSRHAWQGLILGMLTISISLSLFLQTYLQKIKISILPYIAAILLTFLIVGGPSVYLQPVLNQQVIDKWRTTRFLRGLEGFPNSPILSLNDQKGLVKFFDNSIQDQDRVYYLGWFLNAEASTLVNKVFFSLDRYLSKGQLDQTVGNDYLIFGPYQQGSYSFKPVEYLPSKVGQLCEKVVFKNSSYLVCSLRHNINYLNSSYD